MSKLAPFAKAIVPALTTLVATLAYALANGKFNTTSIVIAAVGLAGAVIVYFVPNAAPEVDAAEALFAPVAAGHPDPAPAPSVPLAAVPEPPAAPPTTPPAVA